MRDLAAGATGRLEPLLSVPGARVGHERWRTLEVSSSPNRWRNQLTDGKHLGREGVVDVPSRRLAERVERVKGRLGARLPGLDLGCSRGEQESGRVDNIGLQLSIIVSSVRPLRMTPKPHDCLDREATKREERRVVPLAILLIPPVVD